MGHRPYLPIEPALVDHPKTRALAKTWGCHPYTVVGFLVKLWGYCLEFQEDGLVDGRPLDVLDELAAPCLATSIGTLPTVREALLRAGFIDADGKLHDWEDYAGALVERRRKDRRRKRLTRGRLPQDIRGTSAGQAADTPRTSAPRVEKSRVEKSRVEQQQQPLDYVTRCCVAVNHVLEQQLAGAFAPLVPQVERATAQAWAAAGIPIEFAETTLTDLSARFPNGRNRQPQSLGYFTAALHEAHARRQGQDAGAVPLSSADRAQATLARMEREARAKP